MTPQEVEEKYFLLRDENTTLKKKKNEQEATIKRYVALRYRSRGLLGLTIGCSMYTKLAIIEDALKKKRLEQDNQEDPGVLSAFTYASKCDQQVC